MKKQIKTIPDKVIQLSCGDHVDIYATTNKLEFQFYCDGTGNFFSLTRAEIEELLPLPPIRPHKLKDSFHKEIEQ